MTSTSAVLSRTTLSRALILALFGGSLMACANEPTGPVPAAAAPEGPHIKCSAPPPIPDIWKLEPMLTKDGLITADMSKEQKETVIRDYIRKKNQTYLNCKEKK